MAKCTSVQGLASSLMLVGISIASFKLTATRHKKKVLIAKNFYLHLDFEKRDESGRRKHTQCTSLKGSGAELLLGVCVWGGVAVGW